MKPSSTLNEANLLKILESSHVASHLYRTFDDFLAALKQSKRKNIRQERKSMAKQNLRIERLRGPQITPEIWDAFYSFYLDTTGTHIHTSMLASTHFMRVFQAQLCRLQQQQLPSTGGRLNPSALNENLISKSNSNNENFPGKSCPSTVSICMQIESGARHI